MLSLGSMFVFKGGFQPELPLVGVKSSFLESVNSHREAKMDLGLMRPLFIFSEKVRRKMYISLSLMYISAPTLWNWKN